jgi:hypothetical protein
VEALRTVNEGDAQPVSPKIKEIEMAIPSEILMTLQELPICRVEIDPYKNLHVGLGKKVKNQRKNSRVEYYGEWEIGTYISAWRIVKKGKLISGSRQIIEDTNLETQKIAPLFNEKFITMIELNEYDIRLIFSGDLIVDFFFCSDSDEFLHILGISGDFCVSQLPNKWICGKSLVRNIKQEEGIPNDSHNKIMENGDYQINGDTDFRRLRSS